MTLKNLMKLKKQKERRLKMEKLKERLPVMTVALLFILSMVGLNAAISRAGQPLAIHFLATSRSYTATMQVNDKAEVVWQSMVNLAKKRNPGNLKIKKEDKKKLKFEATKITENDEILWGSLKVTPVSATSCQLMFTATMGGGKPLEQEMKGFVMDIIQQYCDETGLSCKTVE